jgi:hypothetical protein
VATAAVGTRTLRQNANGLAEVAGLTVRSVCVFEHADNKAQFAEKTVFPGTTCCDVRLCETPNRRVIVHDLQEGNYSGGAFFKERS